MASTFTNLLFHIVYSTKYRRRQIQTDARERLYQYIGALIREQQGKLIEIGGMPDHVHILARLNPTLAVSDVLRHTKTNSSRALSELVFSRTDNPVRHNGRRTGLSVLLFAANQL